MATTATRKVLGQSSPAAATDTDLYTAPASTDTVVSSIAICNTNAAAIKYRVHVRISAAATGTGNAIFYDVSLPANSTDTHQLGITLAAGDKVTIRSDTTLVTFTLFGQENS